MSKWAMYHMVLYSIVYFLCVKYMSLSYLRPLQSQHRSCGQNFYYYFFYRINSIHPPTHSRVAPHLYPSSKLNSYSIDSSSPLVSSFLTLSFSRIGTFKDGARKYSWEGYCKRKNKKNKLSANVNKHKKIKRNKACGPT